MEASSFPRSRSVLQALTEQRFGVVGNVLILCTLFKKIIVFGVLFPGKRLRIHKFSITFEVTLWGLQSFLRTSSHSLVQMEPLL